MMLSPTQFKKAEQSIKKGLCICGCGESILNSTIPKALFKQGHSGRIPVLTERQKEKLLEFRKHPCACGCGRMVFTKWAIGHQGYGINGWDKRYRNKAKEGKTGRGRYPSEKEIKEAHSSFLKTENINPNTCWACQRIDITEKCHIICYSDGGDNYPSNLVLLCPLCHSIQHGFAFRIKNWDAEKQYNWLRMMNKWEW